MVRHEELGLFGDMIADGEHGRFDLVRLAVEDTLGGCYRGVLPMVGKLVAGALPPKTSRSPVETARGNKISNEVKTMCRAYPTGWYVLHGAHPSQRDTLDAEDLADARQLAPCHWRTSSGPQGSKRGVDRRYYDAADSYLINGTFRARATVFTRVEADARPVAAKRPRTAGACPACRGRHVRHTCGKAKARKVAKGAT
ncbi:hypothetical protein JL722_6858 [Aureococcus anophagefferens]|nr:hypothetical protein JL722_6858 [Aureococcus anophagefferens]